MPPPARGPSYSDRPLRNAPTDFADEDDFEEPQAAEPAHPRLGGAPRNAAPSHSFDPIEDVPVSPRTQPRIPGIGTPPAVLCGRAQACLASAGCPSGCSAA